MKPRTFALIGFVIVVKTRKPGDTVFTWDFLPAFYAGSKLRSPRAT